MHFMMKINRKSGRISAFAGSWRKYARDSRLCSQSSFVDSVESSGSYLAVNGLHKGRGFAINFFVQWKNI
jgi:hypothetical protein